jgi:hypothetical protein
MQRFFIILHITKTKMDRNESLYFDEFSKKSLSEIREVFKSLKGIGLSEEEIEKYAVEYKKYFDNLEEAKKKLSSSS